MPTPIMIAIPTEIQICFPHPDDDPSVYHSSRLIVRIEDEAAGPFLCLRGENMPTNSLDREDEFYLNSHTEIDDLARLLHDFLNAVEKGYWGKKCKPK